MASEKAEGKAREGCACLGTRSRQHEVWADFVKNAHTRRLPALLEPLTRKETKHDKTKITNRALSPYCIGFVHTFVLSPSLSLDIYPLPAYVGYRFQKNLLKVKKKAKIKVGVRLKNPILSRTQNKGRLFFPDCLPKFCGYPPEPTRGRRERKENAKSS